MKKKAFAIIMIVLIVLFASLIGIGLIMIIDPNRGEEIPVIGYINDFMIDAKNDDTDNNIGQSGGTPENKKNNLSGEKSAVVSDISTTLEYEGEDASLYAKRTMGEEEDAANSLTNGISVKNKNDLQYTVLPYDGARVLNGYLELYMKARTKDEIWHTFVDIDSLKRDPDYVTFNIYIQEYPDAVIFCKYDIFNQQYDFESSFFDK